MILFTFLHHVDPQIRKKTVFKVSSIYLACFESATRLLKTSPYRLVCVMTLRWLVAGFLQKKLGLRTSSCVVGGGDELVHCGDFVS